MRPPFRLGIAGLAAIAVVIPACREDDAPTKAATELGRRPVAPSAARTPRSVAFRPADLSGPWNLTATYSCPGQPPHPPTSERVTVTEHSPALDSPINLGHGAVHGTLHGGTIDFVWIGSFLVCPTAAYGTGTLHDGVIEGFVTTPPDAGCGFCSAPATTVFRMSRS